MQPGFSLPQRVLKDLVLPLGWSVLIIGAFCGLGILFSDIAVNGIMAFSEGGQVRLNRLSSTAVETLVGDLRETVQRRFYMAGLVALIAALIWYVSLFLLPIWRAGQARGRRFFWWGLQSIVSVIIGSLSLITQIPQFALAFGDTFASDASGSLFFSVAAFGTLGAGIAYWLATLIGTPGYARSAVPFGSLFVASARTQEGGE